MNLNWINQVGDWNPQLLREIKGRLKSRNLILTAAISLLSQFLLVMYFQTQLPAPTKLSSFTHKYCTGKAVYNGRKCFIDSFGNAIINWQAWSLDVFTWLSIIGCFTLLVAGTYLIINDLAAEEKRETLNFIRLSPQSPRSILSGKMLGVPILLYMGVILAIPLHWWSALSGGIPVYQIFSFDIVVLAACLLYYSGALLFGIVGSWLGGFQSWLGGGIVLLFLMLTMRVFIPEISDDYPLVFARLINPTYFLPEKAISFVFSSATSRLLNFRWFALPLGDNIVTSLGLTLSIYGLGIYFIWQSLQRCFQDPNTTILSKRQSYLLTACFAAITLGFANWQKLVLENYPGSYTLSENIVCLLFLDFWLFLYLIAAVNPHRQALQDWARYRRTSRAKNLSNRQLIQDLIWSEKSPGLLAIAINATIAIIAISGFIVLSQYPAENKVHALFALALSGSLAMLYATIAQLLLFTKNQHRIFWAAATVGAVIVIPTIIVAIFHSHFGYNNSLWLFSIVGPMFALSPDGNSLSPITVLLSILSYWGILGGLLFQFRRKLVKAGESPTKTLLASNYSRQ